MYARSPLQPRTIAVPETSDRAASTSRRSGRLNGLPIKRDLAVAYRFSLAAAVLLAAVSAGGLALGRTGLYGPDPTLAARIVTSRAGIVVPGFFARDLFNLGVALPVLLATLWAARRGSLVGLLLWPGALLYVLYTYAQYLVGVPFGPLFLAHVLLVVLSAYATIALLASLDGDDVRRRLAGAVPARSIAGTLVVLALLTVGQDGGGALATAPGGGNPTEPLARHIWTADLTISVPATFIGGVLLWRRASLGYVVAAGLLFANGLTPIALATILALQPWLTGSAIDGATIVGLLVFAAVAFIPLWFFVRGARDST
jgi:hypothetical protein